MKKLAIETIATMFLVSMISVPVAAKENEKEDNKNLKERYYEILSSKSSNINNINEENSTVYSEEFAILSLVKNSPEMQVIEDANKETDNEAIIYDSANDIFVYANAVDETKMELILDGIKFDVELVGNKVNYVSQNGKVLTVFEYIPESDESEIMQNVINDKNNLTSAKAGRWILAASGVRGRTNMLLEALSYAVTAAGVIVWTVSKIGGVTFSTIDSVLTWTGAFTAVGQVLYQTAYTVYDRYYKSDCTTYYKDIITIYQYSSYTGKVGNATNYFHSVNPSSAGQNCLAYA